MIIIIHRATLEITPDHILKEVGRMKNWKDYDGHTKNIRKSRGKKIIFYDETIYTFDIETTTIVIHDNIPYSSEHYEELTERANNGDGVINGVFGFMYIWQFSIDDVVYYGRTWEEFEEFYYKVFDDPALVSYVWVHNLSFEFQFLRSVLSVDKIFARQRYKPMYFTSGNVTFKCTQMLTAAKLEKLPDLYNLPVRKLVGNLDYNKIRHSETDLTKPEFDYCEFDCLVVYELIKKFREEYKYLKNIPLTKTGIIRRKCKSYVKQDKRFFLKMKDIENRDPYFYNVLVKCFAGGYTHANYFFANEVLEEVTSFDICSSYPFVMACEPVFPQRKFEKVNIVLPRQMKKNCIYILHLRLTDLKPKQKTNTILSISKCEKISKVHEVDNGRILFADSLETYCTNFDFENLQDFYEFDVDILEAWEAPAGYLPNVFIEFILKIYEEKTTLKGVKGKELEYNRSKSDFNSLYGMSVTNNIRDEIIFTGGEWGVSELTDEDIQNALNDEADKHFLNFAYGVFITSKARYNLLKAVAAEDKWNAYSDTDSMKLVKGFDRRVINRYNIDVYQKIRRAKMKTGLSGFIQRDINGKLHPLGILEEEETYKEFKTMGAKKYCYTEEDGSLHITVAGVPKCGAKAISSVDEFDDDLVFPSSITGKLQSFYSELKDVNATVTDYLGKTIDIFFSYGVGLVPCSYTLKHSSEYLDFEDMYIHRRLYHGG